MPAQDFSVTGSWTANTYVLDWYINGILWKSVNYLYGDTITVETYSEEGYTFNGWDNVPRTMPAINHYSIYGTKTAITYTLTYMIGDSVYAQYQIPFGENIEPMEAYMEGYTFLRWEPALPDTMPAHDITTYAVMTANWYYLRFLSDGIRWGVGSPFGPGTSIENQVHHLQYGDEITEDMYPYIVPSVGYHWETSLQVPATMPAAHTDIDGTWIRNVHKVYLYVNDELWQTLDRSYGLSLRLPDYPAETGWTWFGWKETVPATMPDNDLTFTSDYVETAGAITVHLSKWWIPSTLERHLQDPEWFYFAFDSTPANKMNLLDTDGGNTLYASMRVDLDEHLQELQMRYGSERWKEDTMYNQGALVYPVYGLFLDVQVPDYDYFDPDNHSEFVNLDSTNGRPLEFRNYSFYDDYYFPIGIGSTEFDDQLAPRNEYSMQLDGNEHFMYIIARRRLYMGSGGYFQPAHEAHDGCYVAFPKRYVKWVTQVSHKLNVYVDNVLFSSEDVLEFSTFTLPTIPDKPHYRTVLETELPDVMPREDLDVYYSYDEIGYEIKWILQDNTVFKTEILKHGTLISAPSVPIHVENETYYRNQWNMGNYQYMPEEDIEIHGTWVNIENDLFHITALRDIFVQLPADGYAQYSVDGVTWLNNPTTATEETITLAKVKAMAPDGILKSSEWSEEEQKVVYEYYTDSEIQQCIDNGGFTNSTPVYSVKMNAGDILFIRRKNNYYYSNIPVYRYFDSSQQNRMFVAWEPLYSGANSVREISYDFGDGNNGTLLNYYQYSNDGHARYDAAGNIQGLFYNNDWSQTTYRTNQGNYFDYDGENTMSDGIYSAEGLLIDDPRHGYGLFKYCTTLHDAPCIPYTNMTSDGTYKAMFYGCTSLTSAPVLPATTLSANCYEEMFYGCTSLTSAPALPATTLADYCYHNMFMGCTSLTSAPALPATTLEDYCYYGMFVGCTSLAAAPALSADTLTEGCYAYMFSGCGSITNAPALAARNIAAHCYHGMFTSCTSLAAAPTLPATTLALECYHAMFKDCTSLASTPTLPATTLVEGCYEQMFQGCVELYVVEANFSDSGTYSGVVDNWNGVSDVDSYTYCWLSNGQQSGYGEYDPVAYTDGTRQVILPNWTTGEDVWTNYGWKKMTQRGYIFRRYVDNTLVQGDVLSAGDTIPAYTTDYFTQITYTGTVPSVMPESDLNVYGTSTTKTYTDFIGEQFSVIGNGLNNDKWFRKPTYNYPQTMSICAWNSADGNTGMDSDGPYYTPRVNCSVIVQYSVDGTTWTDLGSSSVTLTDTQPVQLRLHISSFTSVTKYVSGTGNVTITSDQFATEFSGYDYMRPRTNSDSIQFFNLCGGIATGEYNSFYSHMEEQINTYLSTNMKMKYMRLYLPHYGYDEDLNTYTIVKNKTGERKTGAWYFENALRTSSGYGNGTNVYNSREDAGTWIDSNE